MIHALTLFQQLNSLITNSYHQLIIQFFNIIIHIFHLFSLILIIFQYQIISFLIHLDF
jgi:hypothetical protein